MGLEANCVCPHCGAPLFERTHGDKSCVQHGHWFPPEVLDHAIGAGAASRAQQMASRAPTIGRRCPKDRLAMSTVVSPSGRVTVEACGRCGSVWLPVASLDAVAATTPPPAGISPADARSILGFAAVKSVLAPSAPPARR